MKKTIATWLIILASVTTTSCSSVKKAANYAQSLPNVVFSNSKKITVRVTAYWRFGGKTDKWTRRGQSTSGAPLMDGVSAATDPKIIPFGSVIDLPELKKTLVSVDTGTDVKKRTASRRTGRNEPVIDIFFSQKSAADEFNRQYKDSLITDAYIKKIASYD